MSEAPRPKQAHNFFGKRRIDPEKIAQEREDVRNTSKKARPTKIASSSATEEDPSDATFFRNLNADINTLGKDDLKKALLTSEKEKRRQFNELSDERETIFAFKSCWRKIETALKEILAIHRDDDTTDKATLLVRVSTLYAEFTEMQTYIGQFLAIDSEDRDLKERCKELETTVKALEEEKRARAHVSVICIPANVIRHEPHVAQPEQISTREETHHLRIANERLFMQTQSQQTQYQNLYALYQTQSVEYQRMEVEYQHLKQLTQKFTSALGTTNSSGAAVFKPPKPRDPTNMAYSEILLTPSKPRQNAICAPAAVIVQPMENSGGTPGDGTTDGAVQTPLLPSGSTAAQLTEDTESTEDNEAMLLTIQQYKRNNAEQQMHLLGRSHSGFSSVHASVFGGLFSSFGMSMSIAPMASISVSVSPANRSNQPESRFSEVNEPTQDDSASCHPASDANIRSATNGKT